MLSYPLLYVHTNIIIILLNLKVCTCVGALHSRCHDIEERVRLRAVHVVHDVACKHFDAVPMQVRMCSTYTYLCYYFCPICMCSTVYVETFARLNFREFRE